MMSSDEEIDFMSDDFLASCVKDVRPGLINSRAAKHRVEQEKKKKLVDQKNKEKNKPSHLLEKEKRESGLSSSITSENKGFAMLQKMGYKTGQGLGKQGEGRTEPIGLEVKTGRSGLGTDTERKERVEAYLKREMNKMINQKENLDEYRSRMRDKTIAKQSYSDLRASQTVCHQMDLQNDKNEPNESWYWPPHVFPEEEEEEVDEDYAFCEEQELDDEVKLCILTRYLRNTYLYCVWCGTTYEDEKDLERECPGAARDLHT